MRRIICLISLLFITSQIAQAENITSDELLTRFKTHRNTVYQKLNLTEQQSNKIRQIDENVYTQLEPELVQISRYINKLDEIAKSDECTIERVDEVKNEFKVTEKRISAIKAKHEKAVNHVLTREQKTAYKEAKEVQRAEIQKEIEKLQKEQMNNERT